MNVNGNNNNNNKKIITRATRAPSAATTTTTTTTTTTKTTTKVFTYFVFSYFCSVDILFTSKEIMKNNLLQNVCIHYLFLSYSWDTYDKPLPCVCAVLSWITQKTIMESEHAQYLNGDNWSNNVKK